MFIERVQVDEGFLTGIDVRLSPGFNVLIGARGTGKTSLIELIRFCLGARTFTEKARAEGPQQAASVLGPGIVTLTIADGSDRFTISRQATDLAPPAFPKINATVLGQTEIEAVGARDVGRMHLVDRCRSSGSSLTVDESALVGDLKSQTIEIRDLLLDVVDLERRAAELASVSSALDEAEGAQKEALASAEASVQQQEALQKLQDQGAILKAQITLYDRTREQLTSLTDSVSAASTSPDPVEAWSPAAGPEDHLNGVRREVAAATKDLASAAQRLSAASALLDDAVAATELARSSNELQSRELRTQLNALQEGFTSITRRVSDLREKRSQYITMNEQVAARRGRLQGLWQTRREAFERLDALRSARFEDRQTIVDKLNEELGPTIRIRLTRSARAADYASAIQAALRGSGLHHSTLAPLLAAELSPLELVEVVEQGDAALLASTTGIPEERAANVIAHARTANTGEIVGAAIDDGVSFELLDGTEHKPTEQLSIGQRCTVVLPVLLSQPGDVLVIDQPEDHLDNAFVASTLVERLRSIGLDQQVIISSHNANIPVLGEAQRVVHLESNGRRGFVKHQGALDDPAIIGSVTSVMEGGAEAFTRRAEFYARANASE